MQSNQPYKSLYHLINLPPKRNLNPSTESIFQKSQITNEEAKFINPKLKTRRDQFIDEIQEELSMYSDTSYDFKFPESKFPDVPEGKKNNISYERKIEVEEEDTFANKLSDLQLRQIKEKGQFEVRSKSERATIPYVWKINGCLFRGRVKRVIATEEGLARIYSMWDQTIDFVFETVPQNLMKLFSLPVKLFALIFGRKKLQLIYTPDYQREVMKDFWADIMQNQLIDLKSQIGHEFLQVLSLPFEPAFYEQVDINSPALNKIKNQKISIYNQKKSKIDKLKGTLRGIQTKFQSNWVKIRKNVINKISSQIDQRSIGYLMAENDQHPLNQESFKKKDEKTLQKFHQEKYLIYIAHVKQSLAKEDMSKDVVQSLTVLVTIIGLIQAKIRIRDQRLKEIEDKIRENIKKKNPIRSKYNKFVDDSSNKIYLPLKEQIDRQFYEELLKDQDISKYLNEKYQRIYTKYLTFQRNYNTLIEEKKKSMKCIYQPQRVFRTTYILFPPFQVINTNGYYTLKRKEELRTDTSSHFWKCSLYAMRFKSWSINCFKFMVGMCWASPLGLRCLFGIDNFAYDEYCDSNNGAKHEITRAPFLGRFCKVLRGINKSRNAFQALPDRGLFGKNCSRICNYIECYIFRFFIVGVIGVIMLYPVAIILFSCLCFVGILTFWLWVPLCMVICYLFNILVFQFEISFQPSGCLIRSIPLLSLLILVLVYIIKIVASILLLLVIAPVATILYFLYLIFQRVMRTFSDTVMLCLFGCLGRTPSRDTSIAKKVSGPGMSRNYFYSIAQQDVYILTQSALQKLQVNKFIELTRNEIQKNSQKYSAVCNFALKPFGHQRPNFNANRDYITTNTNQLTNHFNRRAQFYMARYPNNPRNVRFTREQIEEYFENSVKIVKSFVEKQKIQDWVFDHYHILYEDYDELTRCLWVQIFNCGQEIFEPIQKIDNRFKLVDDASQDGDQTHDYKGSIMKALEGQIQLSHKKVTFSPARKSLLEKDEHIYHISTLLSLHDSNHGNRINMDYLNPAIIFVPHRNLDEVRAHDKFQKEISLMNKPKVIEE